MTQLKKDPPITIADQEGTFCDKNAYNYLKTTEDSFRDNRKILIFTMPNIDTYNSNYCHSEPVEEYFCTTIRTDIQQDSGLQNRRFEALRQ